MVPAPNQAVPSTWDEHLKIGKEIQHWELKLVDSMVKLLLNPQEFLPISLRPG